MTRGGGEHQMESSRPDIVLYDSNSLNPYGAELAEVLRSEGHQVTRWCAWDDPFPSGGKRPYLEAGRQRVGLTRAVLSRWGGPWLFALFHIASGRRIVFLWTNGLRDLLVVKLLVMARRHVAFVDHNPIPARAPIGIQGRLLAAMRLDPRIGRLVHGAHLASGVNDFAPVVVGHPSYARWAALNDVEHVPMTGHCLRALFLGVIRQDKGSAELPALVRELVSLGMHVTIAGRGDLRGEEWNDLRSNDCVRVVGGGRHVSDAEIAQALRESSVLVAPYRDVTMSGSVLMALSAGLPVAAYWSTGLSTVLPDDFMTSDDPRKLAERAHKLARERDRWVDRVGEMVQELDQASARSWSRALASSDP
jgi:glycosyltransferase involved in cell wall biosynthesis